MNIDHQADFEMPSLDNDEYGGQRQGWSHQFREAIAVKYLRGTETVMAARMTARNPVILTLRDSARARKVTAEWRVKVRDRMNVTRVYELREEPRPSDHGGFLDVLAESRAGDA